MFYPRVESLLAHPLMYIVALGVAAEVVVVFYPVPGLATGVMGLTVAGIMANMFHRRSMALCVRCMTELPVDAPVRAQRWKRILCLEHAIATMTGGFVLVGAPVGLMLPPSVVHDAVAEYLSQTHTTTRTSSATKKTPANSLAVRKLAAKTAVTASKKSGRPVDPRVAKLAAS